MFGADASRKVAVQRGAGEKRRVAVNVLALKRFELGHANRVFMDDAGEIHELGKANDLGMASER
ncbi:hypothetical protein D3C80_1870350 [compost metagenome]